MSRTASQADQQLEGNRVWRVDTPRGVVLQKLYIARRRPGVLGLLRYAARLVLTALSGRKTSPSAPGRWATERRLLAHWRAAGFDVPVDLTEQRPELGGPRILVTEFVEGTTLLELLRRRSKLPRPRRDELLVRFGRDWRRRHDEALRRDDPDLVQEHGTFDHVIVSGERHVTIDLEQAWRRAVPVHRIVDKEIANYLRTLGAVTDPDVFRADVATLVAAYDCDERLASAVTRYLDPSRPTDRLARRLEQLLQPGSGRLERKDAALDVLRSVLEERAQEGATHSPETPRAAPETPPPLERTS